MGSRVLIDTNILIDFLSGRPEAQAEVALYRDRAISVINRIELLSKADDQPDRAEGFLRKLHQFELTPAIVAETINLRRTSKLKLPDAVVLATAHVEGCVLITRNTRDFQPGRFVRVPYTL